jgi:hypothetical protein
MRKLLVIGGVVLVALVVALWHLHAKDDGAAAQTSPSVQGSAVVVATGSSAAAPTVTATSRGDHPALPAPAPGDSPKDYVVGDIRVRDHRAGDSEPLDIPPNVHPAEGRVLPSTLTHEIGQKVKAVVMDCTASLPKDARGDRPRVEGQIEVAIKDKKMTITKATMQLRDVIGDAALPTKQCVEAKSVGLANAAPDQADLESYSINVTFAIR